MFKPMSLAVAIAASLVITPLFAYELSIDALDATSPIFTNLNGDRARWVEGGQQVMITTTFRNNIEFDLPFVGMIEVRDANGVTVFLAWQTGTIRPFSNNTIGVSWVAQEPSGYYQSRTFAFTDFVNPQVLSAVENSEVEVR